MNNACPECGAVYAVAEKDIGRRIACKKCNTALIVAEDGLNRDLSFAPPPPKKDDSAERERSRVREDDERPRKRDRDDEERASRKKDRDDDDRPNRKKDRGDDGDDAERPRERKKRTGPGAGEILHKLKGVADVATWIYGIGLFLTIYSFFSPVIDSAKVASRQGYYESEKIDYEAYRRGINQKPDGKEATQDEKKRLEEREKEWDKKTEPALKDDVAAAESGKKKAVWWNVMFRMIGFFLMAFGSIGYLAPEQSNLKRILGGATILLILLQIIGGGVSVGVMAGGGGGAH